MIFQKSACIETLYTELPFLERFRAARADGVEFVEFWSWPDKDLAAVKAAAAAAGVGISGFNGDAELTRLIGSPYLKVLYDVYHMQLNEGSLCDHIRAYADQFGHIHVADAPGRHEPGTGEIHYPAVFAALEQAGYEGLIGYELFPKTDTKTAVRAIMAD